MNRFILLGSTIGGIFLFPLLIDGQMPSDGAILKTDNVKHYIDLFNSEDPEPFSNAVPNKEAWEFLNNNIPLFECPDKSMVEIYYFRWWTYRKHIKQTPDGYVITEFVATVPWAGKDNSIDCAAGFHIYEGRWLYTSKYLDDYADFWLRKGGNTHAYSFWIADALWNRYLVTGDPREIECLFPNLINNYEEWEKRNLDPSGLFWQIDLKDGMEKPIGDNQDKPGLRPTINSYMYADARAIANIADLLGKRDVAQQFRDKAATIKALVQNRLWDKDDSFFKLIPLRPGAQLSKGRELIGFVPWYANLPDPGYEAAWKQFMDPQGFYAPYGPTTAEQRSPDFRIATSGYPCQWNGPSWPFATSETLTAMANLLNNYRQDIVSRRDYFNVLSIYTKSQHLTRSDGTVVPWIDENLDPRTGEWLARDIMNKEHPRGRGDFPDRGKDYNHSTYCDLIITGLVGLRPQADNTVTVNPLLPEGTWDYFCLDRIPYHGHMLTISYDRTGSKYGKGPGLRVLADGRVIASSVTLGRVTGKLPEL